MSSSFTLSLSRVLSSSSSIRLPLFSCCVWSSLFRHSWKRQKSETRPVSMTLPLRFLSSSFSVLPFTPLLLLCLVFLSMYIFFPSQEKDPTSTSLLARAPFLLSISSRLLLLLLPLLLSSPRLRHPRLLLQRLLFIQMVLSQTRILSRQTCLLHSPLNSSIRIITPKIQSPRCRLPCPRLSALRPRKHQPTTVCTALRASLGEVEVIVIDVSICISSGCKTCLAVFFLSSRLSSCLSFSFSNHLSRVSLLLEAVSLCSLACMRRMPRVSSPVFRFPLEWKRSVCTGLFLIKKSW